MIKIQIITRLNTHRSIRAEAEIVKPLQAQGMNVEIVEAIYPNDFCSDVFDSTSFLKTYGRKPMIGEVGCLLSHDKCMKNFLDDNDKEWAINLEDDAILEDDFMRFARLSLPKIEDPIVIVLGQSKVDRDLSILTYLKQPLYSTYKVSNFELGFKRNVNWCGTVGYAVNRSAAKKFIQTRKSFVADDFKHMQSIGIKVLHLKRFIVFEDPGEMSTIGGKNSNRKFFSLTFIIRSALSAVKSRVKYISINLFNFKEIEINPFCNDR